MVKVLTCHARIYIPDSRLFDADEKADWAARYKTSESLDTLQTLTNQTGKREFSVKKGTNETATLVRQRCHHLQLPLQGAKWMTSAHQWDLGASCRH